MDNLPPRDDDSEPPPEELEMAVEEFLGRPMAGNPADRIEAIQKRLVHIKQQITIAMTQHDDEELARLESDRLEAVRQLAEWKHQDSGRN